MCSDLLAVRLYVNIRPLLLDINIILYYIYTGYNWVVPSANQLYTTIGSLIDGMQKIGRIPPIRVKLNVMLNTYVLYWHVISMY